MSNNTQMQKLDPKTDGSTANTVEQNIAKLKELFPDVFAEGKIDFDALRETLGSYIDDRQERYSFTWNGKGLAKRIAQTPSTGTLRPCPEESVNRDKTQNLFIEGDNLEVLKLLQKSYHRRVKMIYIDPPYNTGGDFIYPDDFKDNLVNYKALTGQVDDTGRSLSTNAETSGRYHTNWLNMMYPRLKLARNLLNDDGVIFVSIERQELSNLIKILDEVFGEENSLGCLIWRKKEGGGMADDYFATEHEYIVVYKKSDRFVWRDEEQEANEEDFSRSDERGSYTLVKLAKWGNTARRIDRPSMYFPIRDPDGKDNFPVAPDGSEGRWRMGKARMAELVQQGLIEFAKRNGKWLPYEKVYFDPQKGKTIKLRSILYDIGGTADGSNELTELFGKKDVFQNPKPTALIKSFARWNLRDGDILLDFFSGSSTAAHAVMALNDEDGGSRKFIMVQLPEPCDEDSEAYKAGCHSIADVGKERLRRVIVNMEKQRTATAKNEKNDQLGAGDAVPAIDLGFKVFKLDTSNIKPWDADFDNLKEALLNAVENIKPDRSEADVLYELLLKYGLDLTVPIKERKIGGKTVYLIGAGALIVCLADKVSLDVVEGIAKLKAELKPEVMRVVFKDAGFKDDVVKTNAVQILRQAGIEDVKSL